MLLLNRQISLIIFLLLNVAFYLSRTFDPVIRRVGCTCTTNVRENENESNREREREREREANNESV